MSENPASPESIAVTHHTLTLPEKTLNYTAHAGHLTVNTEGENEKTTPAASVFFTAYFLKDAPQNRPITFAFNGGPGSSSVWLHLGALSPKRVEMADEMGNAPKPPYNIIDNPYGMLEFCDVVFIDPMSTGYTRAAEDTKPSDYHGFSKDIELIGDFIRLFTSRYGVWGSAKFLAGESYGTTRAAALSEYLQQRHGMYLNGLMLISSVLNFQTIRFDAGNDIPFLMFLPAYTATAWYHGILNNWVQKLSLPEAVSKAREFVYQSYSSALLRGNSLPESQKTNIIKELQTFTGLERSVIEHHNLRPSDTLFFAELLRHSNHTVGRLDSRYSKPNPCQTDPSYTALLGVYGGAMNHYLRQYLNVQHEQPYQLLRGLYKTWNYDNHQNKYVDVSANVQNAVSDNPHLKIYVASGYYDLATPFFATEYTFGRLSSAVQHNTTFSYFEAGHMMYAHRPSLEQLHQDLKHFVQNAS